MLATVVSEEFQRSLLDHGCAVTQHDAHGVIDGLPTHDVRDDRGHRHPHGANVFPVEHNLVELIIAPEVEFLEPRASCLLETLPRILCDEFDFFRLGRETSLFIELIDTREQATRLLIIFDIEVVDAGNRRPQPPVRTDLEAAAHEEDFELFLVPAYRIHQHDRDFRIVVEVEVLEQAFVVWVRETPSLNFHFLSG